MVLDKRAKLGDLGERLVANYFSEQGKQITLSLDPYDFNKDMLIDDELCEVKTQQLWHMENAFTVTEKQLRKCNTADRLIFVETPSKYNGNQIHIYEFPKDKRQTKILNTCDGRTMHLYLKRRANLLTTIDDPIIIELFSKYSVSKWK